MLYMMLSQHSLGCSGHSPPLSHFEEDVYPITPRPVTHVTPVAGEIAQLVKVQGWWPCWQGMNPATGITFSCATIHFFAVYILQQYQRPVPLIPCLLSVYRGVGGEKSPNKLTKRILLGFLLLISSGMKVVSSEKRGNQAKIIQTANFHESTDPLPLTC